MIAFLAISCILLGGGAIFSFFLYKRRTKTKSGQEDGDYENLLGHVDDASTVITPKMDFSIFFIGHNKYEDEKITFALQNPKVSTLFPNLKFRIIKNFESIYGVYKVDGYGYDEKQKLNDSIHYIDCIGMNEYKNNEKELWNYTMDLLKYLVEHPQFSIIVFDNPIEGLIQRNKVRRHFLYFLMRLSQGHEQEHDRKDKQLTLFLQSKNITPHNKLSWFQPFFKVPKQSSVDQKGSIV